MKAATKGRCSCGSGNCNECNTRKARFGKYLFGVFAVLVLTLLAANLMIAYNGLETTKEDVQRVADCSDQEVSARAANTQTVSAEESTTIAPAPGKSLPSLISNLQENVVKIEMPGSRGSGVILEHKDGKTIILTNKHVIEPAKGVRDILVFTADHKNIQPIAAYIAPKNMDLAIIVLDGEHGMPAQIENGEYLLGDDVLALGSPKGIQGSVSKGIISNFGDDKTTSGYEHRIIQTDTAINHGNSGGGLFLASSGKLIGINTFQMKNAEGLNFAIDIHELGRMQVYTQWAQME